MKKGCSECSCEDGGAADLGFGGFGLEEGKRQSCQESENERGGERVKIGAVERKIGGRTEVGAEAIDIGNHACEDDGDGSGAGETREGGALHGE